jgi:Ca-activated chloride channel family protein
MTFGSPGLGIAALVAAGLLAWLYRVLERRRSAQSVAYSNLAFVREIVRPGRAIPALLFGLWVAGTASLALAIARPHFSARVPVPDGIVMLCIDTSGSMAAHDIEPSRESAARSAARAFIRDVPDGTRVGIVTFSTGAALVQAPTADRDEAYAAVDRIPPPNGATAIGDALELAAGQLPPKGRRFIVLLTDGVNNHGVDPLAASAAIGQRGIRIYTVGVGTSGSGELIPGTLEPAEIDEEALRQIAANGGGTYTSAATAESLRSAFGGLAAETVWEWRRIDGSFPVALAGGVLVALALLAGLAAGRFP